MLRSSLAVVCLLAGCGGPARRAEPPPLANAPPPLIERAPEPAPVVAGAAPGTRVRLALAPTVPAAQPPPPPPNRGILDQQLAILRELAVQLTGVEALQVQLRLYDALIDHPDPARRSEAFTLAGTIAASPDLITTRGADRFLYAYGDALRRAQSMAMAAPIWHRLLTELPSSALVPDVYLGFAEAAFEDGDLALAEPIYQRVLAFPQARVARYARYKLAWVHFNLSRFPDALAGFVAIATAPSPTATGTDPLRRAAQQDTVRVYAQVGDPAKALPFFTRVDAGRAGELTLALAEQLADQGRDADATIVYTVARAGLTAADACRATLGLIGLHRRAHRRLDAIVPLLEDLAQQPARGACATTASDQIAGLAAELHREQIQTKGPAGPAIRAWELADQLATTPEARRLAAHAAAELRWQQAAFDSTGGAWATAADAYLHAANRGDPGAAVAAVDAWTNAVRLDPSLADRARIALTALALADPRVAGRVRLLLDTLPP